VYKHYSFVELVAYHAATSDCAPAVSHCIDLAALESPKRLLNLKGVLP
jgi:hypothetical protein